MTHLSAGQLRSFHFNLPEETERAAIEAHLEACADCRGRLEEIKAQFAALDLLKQEVEVPERLVADVLAARGSRRIIPFTRPLPLLTALAASVALLLGLGLLLRNPADQTDAYVMEQTVQTDAAPAARSALSAGSAKAETAPSLAELRAEPPFAPASNIELNVLPKRDGVQLTIYNAADLTLVRETRKLTLKRGWNWLQFMWSNTLIDPTSLELRPVTHAAEIEVTQLVFPPRLRELARWTLFSEFSGEAEFELTYLTSGLRWNAQYHGVLSADEKTMRLESNVRVDNASGEEYDQAQTRLVVGEINLQEQIAELARREHAYGSPVVALPRMSGTGGAWNGDMPLEEEGLERGDQSGLSLSGFADVDADWYFCKEILKQALSEYQLYTIEGRETIPDGWGKRLPNFTAQEIGVTNLYKFDPERWGDRTMRFLSFANTEACRLGERPLPEGAIHVFGTGAPDARPAVAPPLTYIGAASLRYIPVGEEVELELGAAERVKVRAVRMKERTVNHTYTPGGDIAGWDAVSDWKVEITNTKAVPVKVEIMRRAETREWEIRTDAPVEKYDAEHFRFTVTVEPRTKQVIEYTLTQRDVRPGGSE